MTSVVYSELHDATLAEVHERDRCVVLVFTDVSNFVPDGRDRFAVHRGRAELSVSLPWPGQDCLVLGVWVSDVEVDVDGEEFFRPGSDSLARALAIIGTDGSVASGPTPGASFRLLEVGQRVSTFEGPLR